MDNPINTVEWSQSDISREVIFDSLLTVDIAQTKYQLRNDYFETNKILGKYPSTEKIVAYNVLCAVLHAYVTDKLKGKWRFAWQNISIALEASVLNHNARCTAQIRW